MEGSEIDESNVWFVPDEIGASLAHSDKPNMRMATVVYSPNLTMDENTISYSIMWPIEDIAEEEQLTRDYLHGVTEKRGRSSRLAVWYDIPNEYFQQEIVNIHILCIITNTSF